MAGVLVVSQLSGSSASQMLMSTQYIIILLFLLAAAVSGQGNKVTCTIPPVGLSDDAVLTCHFPEDISASRKDFTIYHYVTRGSPDAVVDCWWLGGTMECFVKSGFEYNNIVKTNLTVRLKQVKPENAGTYACQVANYEPSSMESCELKVLPSRFNTCNITLDQYSPSQANLTCSFTEDIGTTRRNFSVYKHSGQDKQRVMGCLWKGEQPECRVQNGFLYDTDVSSYLTLRIKEVTKETAGDYSCWHPASDTSQQKTCSLDIADKAEDQSFTTLAIVLPLGLIVLITLVAAAVVCLLKYKRRREKGLNGEEGQPMLEKNEPDPVTKSFQEHLVKEVSEMYPNWSQSFYFVPPVFFNRTRYRQQSVGGQSVYVPDPSDPSDVGHDLAMQHVMHCLRHVAESQGEVMFVLTQFRYEDYLNSPDTDYLHHRLPLPAGLRETDNGAACFDFLVVHRLHGLLVGVVKAVSDTGGESQNEELNVGHVIVQEVTEAVQQLEKAKRMIQHLMSDQEQHLTVRQTLILPNLRRSALRDALRNCASLVETLRECLGANPVDDPTDLCLCAEQLSDSNTPWDVSHTVVTNMGSPWKWNVTGAEVVPMTDELYLNIIARFFGPATQSILRVPEDYEHFSLPKTLPEAVSLTGDLFARLVLSPDLIKLMDELRLVLSGPRNSEKTTLLSLVVKKWLSSSHDIFVIKNESSNNISPFLQQLKALKGKHDVKSASGQTFGSIYEDEWRFGSGKSTKKYIDRLRDIQTKGFICVLISDTNLDRQRAKECCDVLVTGAFAARLWIICTNNSLELVYEKLLTEVLSPPSVLREVANVKSDSARHAHTNETNTYPPPTDGPKVNHIHHKRSRIPRNHSPQKCLECGREAGDFIAKSLHVDRKDKEDNTYTDEANIEKDKLENASGRQTSCRSLEFRDLLIVFEFPRFARQPNVNDDCDFLKGLRESGITVRTVTERNIDDLGDEDRDVALAVHIRHMKTWRTRRKIVVYVETEPCADFADRRRRALLSCTSQLIWVHPESSGSGANAVKRNE